MIESKAIEKQLIHALRKENVCRLDDQAALNLLKKACAFKQQGKGVEAAIHYAALAAVVEKNALLALRAARNYHKVNDLDAAARWYLITAERYANDMKTSQAVAALRVYHQLKPEEKRIPQRIYDFCIQHGNSLQSPPSILLGSADIAGSKLRESVFFKALNDTYFDQLLRQLTYRKFQDGELIRNMNSQANKLYMIIRGSVSGYLMLQHKRTYLGNTGDYKLCGEISYFTDVKHTEELIAQGITEVFEIPYRVLDTYRTHLPAFNQHIHSIHQSHVLIQQLALTTLFRSAAAQHHQWIASKMKPVSIQKDSVLMRQDEQGSSLYLLLHGRLVVTINPGQEERLLKIVRANSMIGEISIINHQKRVATVTAITDCILMRLDAEDYETYYRQNTSIQAILQQLKAAYMLELQGLGKRNTIDDDTDACGMLIQNVWKNYKS